MYELEMLFVKKRGNEGNMISGFDLIDRDTILTSEKKICMICTTLIKNLTTERRQIYHTIKHKTKVHR